MIAVTKVIVPWIYAIKDRNGLVVKHTFYNDELKKEHYFQRWENLIRKSGKLFGKWKYFFQ